MFKNIYTFLNGKYFFDIIYNHYIINNTLKYGFFISNLLERGLFEFIGPFGLANTLYFSGKNISKLDTGIITSYALYIVLGLIGLIFLIFSPVIFNIDFNFEFRILIIYISSFILYILSL